MDETLSTSPNEVSVSRTKAKGLGKIYDLATAPKGSQEIEFGLALTLAVDMKHFTTMFAYGYCT
jgi:hypothetical protein